MGHVLPVAGDTVADAFSGAVESRIMEQQMQTILVVEDEEMVRGLICEALRRDGYRVLACGDAAEGIEVCERHGQGIDLLLTDVVMPGMNGPEMASRIQKTLPKMRVVFMSGYSEQALVRKAEVDTTFEYLQKPFSLKSLTQKLAKLLGGTAPQPG